MIKSEFLRAKYPHFFYRGYSFKWEKGNLQISFAFSAPPDIYFQPSLKIKGVSRKDIKGVGEGILQNLVFHLGLIEMFSYWKAICSPEIIVNAGILSKEQSAWWKNLIIQGMGEFFYENKIDFTKSDFVKIISSGAMAPKPRVKAATRLNLKARTLIPLGGGKDSIVTLELLKNAKQTVRPFVLNPRKEQEAILKIEKEKNPIIVERTIDPKLLELNRRGYLNGHTPFSAYLAFLTALCAALFDYKYIAVSNERSSNEGNVKYLGRVINHQYSKSFDFEKKFRRYSKKFLVDDLEYFSFLRPLYEIQIAKLFSRFQKYLATFLSCNEAHKTYSGTRKPTGKWCGKCPKCLFVFATLYPFVEEKTLLGIFQKNLFEDKTLIPLMEKLAGERGFKPFECVGTKKESLAAFYLSYTKNLRTLRFRHTERRALLTLLAHFAKEILPKHPNLKKESKKILASWDKKNFLPSELKNALQNVLSQSP